MPQGLYLMSEQPQVGKSTVMLGLMGPAGPAK